MRIPGVQPRRRCPKAVGLRKSLLGWVSPRNPSHGRAGRENRVVFQARLSWPGEVLSRGRQPRIPEKTGHAGRRLLSEPPGRVRSVAISDDPCSLDLCALLGAGCAGQELGTLICADRHCREFAFQCGGSSLDQPVLRGGAGYHRAQTRGHRIAAVERRSRNSG